MLTEQTLKLINGAIDGELSPAEQEELDVILEQSGEARAMMAELQKLAEVLEAATEQEPPSNLSRRILDELEPSRQPSFSFSFSDLFSPFRPATAGMAFAVGLLAAVGVYEWAGDTPAVNSEHMVGTMMANPAGAGWTELDTVRIDEAGLSGTLALRAGENFLVIDIDLESARQTGIEIGLADTGLEFGGITLTPTGQDHNEGIYEFSGGDLRLVHQGGRTFSVLLPVVADREADGRDIRIKLSSGGKRVFSGVLKG